MRLRGGSHFVRMQEVRVAWVFATMYRKNMYYVYNIYIYDALWKIDCDCDVCCIFLT
jgi:hypothetical protein